MTLIRSLATLAAVSLIAACGGGSDDKGGSAATGLEGTWLTGCESATYEFGPLSARAKVVVTATTARSTIEYFATLNCAGTAFATVTDPADTYAITGSKSVAGNPSGTVTAQKMQTTSGTGAVSFTGSTAPGSTASMTAIVYPGTTLQIFEVDNQDTDGSLFRDIAWISGGVLYTGDLEAGVDADGYPNALDYASGVTRQ
jgi:hypothetical protein